MVQAKKTGDQTNGTTKYKEQPSNMSFPRRDMSGSRGGSGNRNDGRSQNGNAGGFRTDAAISGNRVQGERPLQKWVPDSAPGIDGSLEALGSQSKSGQPWDQFAENERRFGLTTDYDERIYTTTIDKSHPQYEQRLAEADKKAREIERSTTTNSHVAEERITDNLTGDGGDEEDKYSGVRRQDFPALATSNNKYTPPARRAPTAQSTVPGAPVDPAILSTARPNKTAEKSKPAQAPKPLKTEPNATVAIPTTSANASSSTPAVTTETEAVPTAAPISTTVRKTPPQARNEATPNATATVERDVVRAFNNFANQQRQNVQQVRQNKARNDKEVKLNDLKKFADSFKLNTPVPSDLVSIIAKDPAKQKEIQERARRNAEEAKSHPSETAKPIAPAAEPKLAPRPTPTSHGASPAAAANANANANRQNLPRNQGFANQGQYNSQSYRNDRSSQQQLPPRHPGNLGSRLRSIEQNKQGQSPLNPIPNNEGRLPPTGPSNSSDPNFSRRSSGVISAQGGRLNPNSSEFRPSPHAASFNPHANPSNGSSPKSNIAAVAPAPASRSLLKRKPIAASERPSIADKFNALEHIKTILPPPEKNWKATGDLKPAYDTPPVWKSATENDEPDATIHLTYTQLFEKTPYPAQTLSPPHASHAAPQVPHQHQLPFHLQSHNMMPRQAPRQPQMGMGNQHHGPNAPYNNPDDHRMMSSHSAQSFASPRMQNNAPLPYPSPMNQPAQLAYNPAMGQYAGGAPIAYRSLSQTQQFNPQPLPPMMIQNHNTGFMVPQGMPPGQFAYQGGQPPFIPPGNGHPPVMPVNGYPSPGRGGAPMMMNQGSQQGHQPQPMFAMNNGMSPNAQYAHIYQQQGPGQMPVRGYPGPTQFGTSPQQVHQFVNHRNNHQNGGNYNNKSFQPHGQHLNGPSSNQVPNGPQARNSEGGEESK